MDVCLRAVVHAVVSLLLATKCTCVVAYINSTLVAPTGLLSFLARGLSMAGNLKALYPMAISGQ